jgi:hypothetical protein
LTAQAAHNPAQDADSRKIPSALVIQDEGRGVVYLLPRSAPNISSILLMLILLAAIIGLPIMVHLRFFATTPKPVAIIAPILSLIISLYLITTILMELFGSTRILLTHGKIRLRQQLGFFKIGFGAEMDTIRYLGVARSYAYKQSNADPVDLFFIKKGSWTRTAIAVYQNPDAITQLLADLRQRFPEYAARIIPTPPEDSQINVTDWLKVREQVLSIKEGNLAPVHPGIQVRTENGTITVRARSISHRLPRFVTHPVTCVVLLAALFGLGVYHLQMDKTLYYAKPVAGVILIAWLLGGLNRFFTEQDRVILRITPKRIQVCRISPFGKTRASIARDRLRSIRVGSAEMGGGYCLKVQYRGLTRQSPEFLEHRPIEELAWFTGIIEKELKL